MSTAFWDELNSPWANVRGVRGAHPMQPRFAAVASSPHTCLRRAFGRQAHLSLATCHLSLARPEARAA